MQIKHVVNYNDSRVHVNTWTLECEVDTIIIMHVYKSITFAVSDDVDYGDDLYRFGVRPLISGIPVENIRYDTDVSYVGTGYNAGCNRYLGSSRTL